MKKTMLKVGGDENLHSGSHAIKPRRVGQQIGVICFGDDNQFQMHNANARGHMVVVNGDHATIHKM